MKKHFILFLVLFSIGTLSAQTINFLDTNGLKSLLCNKTWIRYYINADSTFSDRIMDSLKFYGNGTFYKSAKPKDDTVDKFLPGSEIITGKWVFALTGKISKKDTATNYIKITLQSSRHSSRGYDMVMEWTYLFIDGRRIVDTRYAKMSGNLGKPFIVCLKSSNKLYYEMTQIWQEPRQTEKTKNR